MADDIYEVKPEIAMRAHINSLEEYRRRYQRSLDDPEAFWGEEARALDWSEPWRTVVTGDYEGSICRSTLPLIAEDILHSDASEDQKKATLIEKNMHAS